MTEAQISLDLVGQPSGRAILNRIRTESRDESEKGRWFEQLFMRIALQQPEFEIDRIWRWAERIVQDGGRVTEAKEAEQGIYAHVAAASGLGRLGQFVADEIADTVRP